MEFNPTPEQARAINIIDQDLAVSAGAGSGKTKVLVERFLNLLRQGVSLSNIVAITFTKKAAQEMKDRVRQYIGEQASKAQISTIHSYCQRIIAEHPKEAGIDPRFTMIEEWQERSWLNEITKEVVLEAIEAGTDEIIEIYEENKTIAKLASELGKVYTKMRQKGVQDFSIEDRSKYLLDRVEDLKKFIEDEMNLWSSYWETEKPTAAQAKKILLIKEKWRELKPYLEIYEPPQLLQLLVEFKENFKGSRNKLKESIQPLIAGIGELIAAINDWFGNKQLIVVSELLEKINHLYTLKKTQLGVLDFNDLELLAYRLLKNPVVKDNYSVKHLMVDEFQDTNRMQKRILNFLRDQNTCFFIVGDAKQSIYRFRGAEVDVFLETQADVLNRKGEHIMLQDNFRSLPGVIRFTNHLFANLMQDDAIEFQPSKENRLQVNCPNIEMLITEQLDEENLQEMRIREAYNIAIHIQDLVKQREVKYQDIILLFQSMSNAKLYENALHELDIPFVNLSGRGFYARQEIKDVLNYINWLQDPEDNVSKTAVLRSPFFGVSDQGLFWYAQNNLTNLMESDRKKINKANELYLSLKKILHDQIAPRLLVTLLDETDFIENLSGEPSGEQRIANIEKLTQKSWELWAAGYVSIEEQLNYIEETMNQSTKEEEARLDAEHADVVRLMTIHGSKGLEFPVVILPDLKGEVYRNDNSYLNYHPSCGLAIKGTSDYQMIKDTVREEEFAEAKRLLYVACTRAMDCLVLSGIGEPEQLATDRSLKEMRNWWQWICNQLNEMPTDLFNIITFDLEEELKPTDKLQHSTKKMQYIDIQEKLPPLPLTYDSVNFSATSLMIYSQCPRRFYYRYILNAPEVSANSHELNNDNNEKSMAISPLQRGNIIHRICEQIVDPLDKLNLLDWAIQMEGTSVNSEEKNFLLQIVERYIESEFFGLVVNGQVKREVEFMLPLGNNYITGTIDQLITTDQGLEIMDLKTNNISSASVQQEALNYNWQLHIYAWALNAMVTSPIIGAKLYFLMPNKIYTHPDAHLSIKETEQWLIEACQHIQVNAENINAFPKGIGCQHCSYQCS